MKRKCTYGCKGKRPYRYSDAFAKWRRAVVENKDAEQIERLASDHDAFLRERFGGLNAQQ